MTLSIIIPYYNRKEYTDELLDCLDKQINADTEVILVDDGSDVAYKPQYKWLTVIRKENGGVSSARNVGLDNATGGYITFIDCDDLVADNYISTIFEKIAEGFDYCYMSWKTLPGGWDCEVKLKSVEDNFPEFNLCVWNRIYKRSLIGKKRFNEKKQIAEDAEFIRVVRERGKKAFIGEFMYYYRITPGSLTQRWNAGEIDTKRFVYYYPKITEDMTFLIDEVKKADKDGEVMIMTNDNAIPELAKYAMVIKPRQINGTELRGEHTPLFHKIELPYRTQVVIWTPITQEIGGIETWIYNFVRQMSKYYDILVLYESMNPKHIARLEPYVPVVRNGTKKIVCDTLIINRFTDVEPKGVRYKQKLQMVHTCAMNTYTLPETDAETIFVSETAKKSFNGKGKTIKNMTFPQESDKALFLVSATRLTFEKGEQRMLELADALTAAGIQFIWLYFTYQSIRNARPGMIHMKPTLDIMPYIKAADYLVQLSDHEAFCYSIVEALEAGTAVITTPLEVLSEIGFEDGINGYTVPFEGGMDVTKLLTVPQFDYTYNNANIIKQWRKLLGNTKPTHSYKPPKLKTVIVTQDYRDIVLNRILKAGDILNMPEERAETVKAAGYVKDYGKQN